MSNQTQQDYEVECAVCGQRYKNESGSTPCCGALAFLVKDGEKTNEAVVFVVTPNNSGTETIEIPE